MFIAVMEQCIRILKDMEKKSVKQIIDKRENM